MGEAGVSENRLGMNSTICAPVKPGAAIPKRYKSATQLQLRVRSELERVKSLGTEAVAIPTRKDSNHDETNSTSTIPPTLNPRLRGQR